MSKAQEFLGKCERLRNNRREPQHVRLSRMLSLIDRVSGLSSFVVSDKERSEVLVKMWDCYNEVAGLETSFEMEWENNISYEGYMVEVLEDEDGPVEECEFVDYNGPVEEF